MVEATKGVALAAEIDALHRLAVEVMNQHRRQRGRCAVCCCIFPCEWAVLADHNLALTSGS